LWEVVAGFLIGGAIGITGVGGGIITAPVLILLFHLPPAQGVGTALIFSAAVKANALLLYLKRRQVDFVVLGWLLLGGVPGALAGSVALDRFKYSGSNPVILTFVGLTVMVSALFNLRRSWTGVGVRENQYRRLPWLSLPIGMEVGFSSAGSGALGSIILLRFTQLKPVCVVGTDLAFGMVLSAISGGIHAAAGNWDRAMLVKLLIGGWLGASVGAWYSGLVPARMLRVAILLWAIVLGGLLAAKGLGRLP